VVGYVEAEAAERAFDSLWPSVTAHSSLRKLRKLFPSSGVPWRFIFTGGEVTAGSAQRALCV
jgi:hypothetical protein